MQETVTNHIIHREEIEKLSLSDIISLHKLESQYFNCNAQEGSINNEMWIVIDNELGRRINKLFSWK